LRLTYVFLLTALFVCTGVGSAHAQSLKALGDLSRAYEAVARKVSPAVVQIVASGYIPSTGGQVGSDGLLSLQRSGGSGVILASDGYIVTNAHVVRGARRVQVMLPIPPEPGVDWRSIVKPQGKVVGAQIVGIDEETDLAVLKVDETGLPFLVLADSDNLRAGQLVLAFGSPLGLDNTVTSGVVSAVARQLSPEDPMIYIQTDAPINPGNSGGPLVDTDGRVVGINTSILSQSGGSEGLGFAAPSNIVRAIFEQIKTTGTVHRGAIGVKVQTITPVLAEGLGLSRNWGVLISDIAGDGPAARSGLQIGDIVVALNDKPMENARQFTVNIYQYAIGDFVRLDLLRDGQSLRLESEVVDRPNDPSRFAIHVTPDRNLVRRLGILGLNLDREMARLLPPLRRDQGVVVGARSQEALLWERGFVPGDVIYSVNQIEIASLDDLRAAVAGLKNGDAIVAQVERNSMLTYIAFRVE
jgi:serine protease Do